MPVTNQNGIQSLSKYSDTFNLLTDFFCQEQYLFYPCKKTRTRSNNYQIQLRIHPLQGNDIVLWSKKETRQEVEASIKKMLLDELSYQLKQNQGFYLPPSLTAIKLREPRDVGKENGLSLMAVPPSLKREAKLRIGVGHILRSQVALYGSRGAKLSLFEEMKKRIARQGVYRQIKKFLHQYQQQFSKQNILLSHLFGENNYHAFFSLIMKRAQLTSTLTTSLQLAIDVKQLNRNFLHSIRYKLDYFPYLANQLIYIHSIIKDCEVRDDFEAFKNSLKQLISSLEQKGLDTQKMILIHHDEWLELTKNKNNNERPGAEKSLLLAFNLWSQSPGKASYRSAMKYQKVVSQIRNCESIESLLEHVSGLQKLVLRYPQLNIFQHELAASSISPQVSLSNIYMDVLSKEDQQRLFSLMKDLFLLDTESPVDKFLSDLNALLLDMVPDNQHLIAQINVLTNYKNDIYDTLGKLSLWNRFEHEWDCPLKEFIMISIKPEGLDDKINRFIELIQSGDVVHSDNIKKVQTLMVLPLLTFLNNLERKRQFKMFLEFCPPGVVDCRRDDFHYIHSLEKEIERLEKEKIELSTKGLSKMPKILEFLSLQLKQIEEFIRMLNKTRLDNREQESNLACSSYHS